MHGLFYINTYPSPTPVVISFLKGLYPGIRISSFFMYSCNQVSLTQKCQNCFIYNSSNFINFRIKTSGIQVTLLCYGHDEVHILIAYGLSSHQNNLRVNAVVLIDFSFNCIVYIYLKYGYHSIYIYISNTTYFKYVFNVIFYILSPLTYTIL